MGTAVGCALSGLRPVVEIMFMDFTTLAMDAIVNQAAKARFMFGGQTSVPMVLRTPHGGGLSAGPPTQPMSGVLVRSRPGAQSRLPEQCSRCL